MTTKMNTKKFLSLHKTISKQNQRAKKIAQKAAKLADVEKDVRELLKSQYFHERCNSVLEKCRTKQMLSSWWQREFVSKKDCNFICDHVQAHQDCYKDKECPIRKYIALISVAYDALPKQVKVTEEKEVKELLSTLSALTSVGAIKDTLVDPLERLALMHKNKNFNDAINKTIDGIKTSAIKIGDSVYLPHVGYVNVWNCDSWNDVRMAKKHIEQNKKCDHKNCLTRELVGYILFKEIHLMISDVYYKILYDVK